MIALPKPLNSWVELLSSFPDDIQSMVTSLVNQLSPLIDNIKMVENLGLFEPDGLEGVGRSGRYERLLLSEWVLQEHFPDEFIRRAGAGEHLFSEMKRIEHKENKTSFVLFDCGPEQLGKPRIVQLSLLILLARRADRNGSIFKWGVMQEKEKTLNEGISKESVLQWLQQRTIRLTTQSSLEEWIELYLQSNINEEADIDSESLDYNDYLQDFWLISNSTFQSPIPSVKQIQITEPLLKPGFIDVALMGSGGRNISLELAREDINVKIIRNPFNEKSKALQSGQFDAAGSWVLSSNGRRIACRENEDTIGIYTFNLSNSKSKKEKLTFDITKGQELLGIHISKKRAVILSFDRDFFYFHNFPHQGQLKKLVKTQNISKRDKEDSFLSTVLYRSENNEDKFLILDSQKNLREMTLSENKPLFSTKSSSVILLGSLITCDYYIEYNQKNNEIIFNWYLGAYIPCKKIFKLQQQYAEPKVFIHGSGPWHKGSIGCLAFEADTNIWQLVSGAKNKQVNIDENDLVIGTLFVPEDLESEKKHKDKKKIALAVLKNDLKSIFAVFDGGEYLLTELSSEFKRGNLNPRHPYIHYMNSNNELIVTDLINGGELFKLSGEGGMNAHL